MNEVELQCSQCNQSMLLWVEHASFSNFLLLVVVVPPLEVGGTKPPSASCGTNNFRHQFLMWSAITRHAASSHFVVEEVPERRGAALTPTIF